MPFNATKEEIEKTKNQIVDSTLLIGLCMGFVAFVLGYYPFNFAELELIFYSDIVSISALLLIWIFRAKISIEFKAIVVILVLNVLVISDTLVWGIYSMNKVLIVVIPFYALFVFKFKKAVIIYLLAMFSFLAIGFFELYERHEPSFFMDRLHTFSDWLEGAALLTAAALALVVFTKKYNTALSDLIKSLQGKNQELRESEKQLESRNASLKKTLGELQLNNEKLTEYAFINSHLLRAPLARMLGIAGVLGKDMDTNENQELIKNFTASAEELDKIVSKINNTLEERKELQRDEISGLLKKTK